MPRPSSSRSAAGSRTTTSRSRSAGSRTCCAWAERTPSCSGSTASTSMRRPGWRPSSAWAPRWSRSQTAASSPGSSPASRPSTSIRRRQARCWRRSTTVRRSRRGSTPSASSRSTGPRRRSAAWRSRPPTTRQPRRAGEIETRRGDAPLRPCHNDLLAANFIQDGDRLWIVDWEYAGMGDPFFDLGNFAVEPRARRRRRAEAAGCVRLGRPRRAARHALHVGLPRSDVGRRPAGDLGARLRLRRLRRAALRAGARMRTRARAVVIGGGVGGCSILYWLTRLGWDDVVLVERADLTSGSTFHSAGLVGQLRSSLALTRMMMSSVELYRTLGDEVGLETGLARGRLASARLVRGADGGASPPGRLGEDIRPSARAGLRRRGAAAVPADVDRRRARRRVPADRRLHRPVPADASRSPKARGARGAEIAHQHARDRDRRRARARHRRRDRQGRRSRQRSSSTRAGCSPPSSGGSPASTVPVIPMAHEYLVTRPSGPAARHADDARPLAARLLPRRVRRARHGRLRARPGAVGRSTASPRDFNGRLLAEDWAALRGADRERDRPRAGARRRRGRPADQRAGGVHAGRRVHPRARPTCAASGSPPASARTASPARAGWASSSPSGSSRARRASTSGRWTRAASAADYADREYTLARTVEVYSTYYDVKYPGHERQAGRPLRTSPTYRRLPRAAAPRSARSPAGSGRTGSSRTQRAGDECAAAARLGRDGSGRRRSAPSTGAAARRPALFDETSFAKIEVCGPGRGRPPRAPLRQPASRATSGRSPTRRCSTRAAGSSATSRSRGSPTTASGSSPAPRSAATTSPGSARTRPRTGRSRSSDVTSRYACLGLWGPAAREILGHGRRRATSRSATCARARSRSRACRASRCASRTSASSAGSSTARSSSGLALWDALWEAGRPHGLVAGGYKAIDSLRLEKGYRVWGADITPEDTPYEAGLGFAVKLDKGDFVGREALLDARRSRSGGWRASSSPSRARSRSARSRCGSTASSSGRVTSGGYGYTVERSIAYAYVPAAHAEPGPAGRGRDLRRVGRGRGCPRAALRSCRRAAQGLSSHYVAVAGAVPLWVSPNSLSMRSSSAWSPCRIGPLNHFLADSAYHPPNRMKASATGTGV